MEVRERIVKVRDTVKVYLPEERAENTTSDTTSRIETSAAVSTAMVSGGQLHHALWNKRQPIGVAVDMEFKVEDISTEHITTVTNTVEVEADLSWWQQTQIKGFWVLLSAVGLFVSRSRILQLFR